MNYEKAHEKLTIRIIASHHELSRGLVKKMRKIEIRDALKKFLSKEDFNEIIKRKLYPLSNHKKSTITIQELIANIHPKEELYSFFSKTKKGINWYNSKFPCNECKNRIYRYDNPPPGPEFYNKAINI